jgi:drug/metabolite transporter (DMT)-like permease
MVETGVIESMAQHPSSKTAHREQGGRNWQQPLKLAAGMAAFGSATPVSKIITEAMPVFIGSVFRVALGSLALGVFMGGRFTAVRSYSRRVWLYIFAIAIFGMFGFTALMLYGMKMVPGVVGATVMSTTPAITAAASMLFLKDRPTWRKLVAICLAVTGVAVLQWGRMGDGDDGTGSPIQGSLLILGAVCCEAAYTLLGKKASQYADPLTVAFLASVLSLPLFLPFAVWQWAQFDISVINNKIWLAVVWYGVGTLALGSWLWYTGIAKVQGTIAAAFMGIMPLSALVLSYILLDESFQMIHLLGFGTVFSGVVLISWEHARMQRQG